MTRLAGETPPLTRAYSLRARTYKTLLNGQAQNYLNFLMYHNLKDLPIWKRDPHHLRTIFLPREREEENTSVDDFTP
jgi:hypothetical protein